MEPAVVTFRPDNFLTIGLIGAIVYAAAVVIAQVLMRSGVIPATPAVASAPDRVLV